MLYMKRLKILLHCNYLYYGLVLIMILMALFLDEGRHLCSYGNLFEDEFVINKIVLKDRGVRLYLNGDEKIIASYYLEDDAARKFLNDYKLGDKVVIKGEEVKLKNNTVRNTFNYKKYLNYQRIYHSVVINDIKLVKRNKNLFYKLKNYLIDRQNAIDKSYMYTSSLLFGDNSLIDENVMESYRSNGVSHLFAISGLHVSLFLLLFSKFLEKLGLKGNKKYLFFIFFLLFYMFLTNFSMSVMRASIFTMLIIVNKVFKFGIKTINLLLFTLVVILFINPFNLFNIGLQYSFLISFFLIKCNNIINGLSSFKKLVFVSLVAFFVSYPITVNNFYEVNFLSILYNLVFVPFVSYLLLPFALIVYFLPVFDKVLYIFISLIEISSQFIQRIDIFKVTMCKLNVTMVLLYYLILCLVLSKYKRGKKKYWFLLLLFYFMHFLMPFSNDNYVSFLDVNQGDALVINVKGNVTLIDTGGLVMYSDSKYTYQLAKNRILPYLKSQGIRKIDNMVLTHGDSDHMREAYYLVENFKVEKVIFNQGSYNLLEQNLIRLLNKKDIHYEKAFKYLKSDKYMLEFLDTGLYDNENDNSNVVYFYYNGVKMLFMGDASAFRETDIIEKYDVGNIDFLKVGHHGSSTSSSKSFINMVQPKYSIISVGENNRYGHPNKEVLDVLSGSKIYRTDLNGSIEVIFGSNGYNVKTCSP